MFGKLSKQVKTMESLRESFLADAKTIMDEQTKNISGSMMAQDRLQKALEAEEAREAGFQAELGEASVFIDNMNDMFKPKEINIDKKD